MKLYYAAGACSLSPHIVALEAGIPIELEKVDTKAKRTAQGEDFWQINPKGYVPALALDNGELLTEGPAIVQYLADLKPESGLAPANGTVARYRLQEVLGYINSELHKTYSPLFKPDTPDAVREERKEYLHKRYALLEQHLAKHEWLVGDRFSAADAYLFTVTNWAKHVSFDLTDFPAILAFQQRVAERPAVQAAMQAEGLLKAA
ncbi:glutathione transferase GstA [Dyella sp. C11]|uniref:glutathione transferase GstA n=1 Tax=Dyella sp. C11 TaxID=2126991 RepID=UPI000D65A4C0|nr:glutathione transferase GstA [Dyella sp. C11]